MYSYNMVFSEYEMTKNRFYKCIMLSVDVLLEGVRTYNLSHANIHILYRARKKGIFGGHYIILLTIT